MAVLHDGKKLTRYETFKKDPKSGLHQIRKYNPKIKFDPFRIKTYNNTKTFDNVKFVNKPLGDVLAKETKEYKTKAFDHFYEYNQAQDEIEEKEKQQKKKEKEKEMEQSFFPEGLWKGTIRAVQRNFLLLYSEPSSVTPMHLTPSESKTSSPVQSQPITPTGISPAVSVLSVQETVKEPDMSQRSPEVKPKKVVIQEKPTEIQYTEVQTEKPEPPTTLIPGYIDINYSSKHWNNF